MEIIGQDNIVRGPVTTKAWPDVRTGTGEVVKNFKILWAR